MDRGNARNILSGYYTKKWKNMYECKPLAYKVTLNSDLNPDMFCMNVYFAGQGFSCDPESFKEGPFEPTISTLDILRKGVKVQGARNNRNKRKLGIVYTGIDPLSSPLYKCLWRRTMSRKMCLFTDGLNYSHHWPEYINTLNVVLKDESQVDNIGFYREMLFSKLKQVGHIEKRRLVCRYTDDTENCIMDTAMMIKGGLDGWEILQCYNGVIDGTDVYGFEED